MEKGPDVAAGPLPFKSYSNYRICTVVKAPPSTSSSR